MTPRPPNTSPNATPPQLSQNSASLKSGRPTALIALAVLAILVFGAHFRSAHPASSAAASLPTAKEIVARYDEALGSRAAIERHTSSTMRGTTEIHERANVAKLPFVYYSSAPYRRIERTTLPGESGEIVNGFDGDTAWSVDPRGGPQIYTGDERESMKRDADFYYSINELVWFRSMETVGLEDFEGRSCYHLHGINNWGKSNDHFYDRETGLLAGYEFNSELGATHQIFSDYKKIDGVQVPTKQTVKVKSKDGAWQIQQILTFESIAFNDVDPAVFTPPQSVRDLVAKAKPAASR
ncbi:MAG: hypothetical protein ACRD59_14790 [Candidatus Acidiferrales bacterium]